MPNTNSSMNEVIRRNWTRLKASLDAAPSIVNSEVYSTVSVGNSLLEVVIKDKLWTKSMVEDYLTEMGTIKVHPSLSPSQVAYFQSNHIDVITALMNTYYA